MEWTDLGVFPTCNACMRFWDDPGVRMTPEAVAFVESRLSDGWSPEQISGRMKAEGMRSVSHEAIYRHVWLDKARGGSLHRHWYSFVMKHLICSCSMFIA